jgi:hypothetical protein
MKVEFFCDSGANIKSCRKEIVDTVKNLGLDPGEWEKMTDDEKYEMAREWAENRLEIGFKEIDGGDD